MKSLKVPGDGSLDNGFPPDIVTDEEDVSLMGMILRDFNVPPLPLVVTMLRVSWIGPHDPPL
jgi:hypothetical protein